MDIEDEELLHDWEDDTALLDFDNTSCHAVDQNSPSKSQFSSKEEILLQQIDEDLDYAIALSLQAQYSEEHKENTAGNLKKSISGNSEGSKPLSIIDEQWELIDPHPDIHALFMEFDARFFYGKLKSVEVRWSPRMTLCAGVCSYEGRGGFCSVRLSVPLLKLRPRKDLIETLLHEMIHAYLFVTHNNKDRDGHGPEFLSHMNRINKETGTRISVYHSFHDEVDLYRQHWWKCNGPCQKRRPFFGIVRRAMNRVPGPSDPWWADHQASCGGQFIKIKEPDNYKKKTTKRKNPSDPGSKGADIRGFLKNDSSTSKIHPVAKTSNISGLKSVSSKEDNVVPLSQTVGISAKKSFIPFNGTGFKLGGGLGKSVLFSNLGTAVKKTNVPPRFPGKVKSDAASYSKAPKLPRLSSVSNTKRLHEDQSSTSSISNPSTKLIQSPIENFLSSKIVAGSSKCSKKSLNFNDISKKKRGSDGSKVPCPVCLIFVQEEDINSHLDKCLLNK